MPKRPSNERCISRWPDQASPAPSNEEIEDKNEQENDQEAPEQSLDGLRGHSAKQPASIARKNVGHVRLVAVRRIGLPLYGPMQTASLDLLEKTQLPANQVRAILQAMELEITARQGATATKDELKDAIHSLHLEMEAMRGDFKGLESRLTAKPTVHRGQERVRMAPDAGGGGKAAAKSCLGEIRRSR